jgi:hypothetical protein
MRPVYPRVFGHSWKWSANFTVLVPSRNPATFFALQNVEMLAYAYFLKNLMQKAPHIYFYDSGPLL